MNVLLVVSGYAFVLLVVSGYGDDLFHVLSYDPLDVCDAGGVPLTVSDDDLLDVYDIENGLLVVSVSFEDAVEV
jgi:hypothetical protein